LKRGEARIQLSFRDVYNILLIRKKYRPIL